MKHLALLALVAVGCSSSTPTAPTPAPAPVVVVDPNALRWDVSAQSAGCALARPVPRLDGVQPDTRVEVDGVLTATWRTDGVSATFHRVGAVWAICSWQPLR